LTEEQGTLPSGRSISSRQVSSEQADQFNEVLGGFALVEDVAPRIGVAKSTLHEWCRRGRFPNRRLPGARRVLIPLNEIPKWFDGCELETIKLPAGGRIVRPKSAGDAKRHP
jgi:predicted DNA-binding transcriptional regulator AlpA